jgi:serine palmitoyltransferase
MCPVEVQQIMSCLKLIDSQEGQKRIAQLRKNSTTFRRRLKELGAHVLGNDDSPVIPVMSYHPYKLQDLSRCCLKNGLAIVVVGYPACPITACRIRFCMSASHTDEDIEKAIDVTYRALKESSCLFFNTKEPQEIYHAPNVTIEELTKDITKEEYYREMTPLYENSDKREIKEDPIKPDENQIELSSYDLFDFENNKKRIDEMIKVINIYGCGSCGPRQFYGGTLEHLNLEETLCRIYNTTDAVVYSYGNNTLTSVIPCYGKNNDVILVDEFCNYPIQLGCRLARAKTIKFKHNNFEDLKEKVNQELKTLGYYNKISIITEGVFQCDYSIAPLKEYSTLRNNNVILIVDDSLGIGALGKTLKGSIEYAGLTMNDIDMLCGSLEFVCDGVGGFVVGKYSLIDKQRLFGAGYIFSASAPPLTCTGTKYSLETFEKNGEILRKDIENRRLLFNRLFEENKIDNVEIINKDENLPYILINSKDNNLLVEKLRKKGYYTVIQQHLQEDWCQNNYIRFNLGTDFNNEKNVNKFLNVLKRC